jgi:biopolymer transport protein ExbD
MKSRLRERLFHRANAQPTGRNILIVAVSAIVLISALLFYRYWIGATETCNPCFDLPKTWVRTTLPDDGVFVYVRNNGMCGVYVPGQNLGRGSDPESLGAIVASVAAQRPDQPFFIKADTSISYQYIDAILDGLCSAGSRRVYFITDQQTVSEPPEGMTRSGP